MSNYEFAKIRNFFKRIAITKEKYDEILEEQVFQNVRFQNNIKETAEILDLDEKIVSNIIKKMIVFIAHKLIMCYNVKTRISVYGFFYMDLINPLFNKRSKQYYKNE